LDVFATVTEEARLLGVSFAMMGRYDQDGTTPRGEVLRAVLPIR
jgi:hypothetical protein